MSEAIVITGWGQVTQPKNATPPFLDPIDMMERAARDAGAQAGAGVLETIDAMLLVRTQSRSLTDPGGELARRLGARPRLVRVSGIGGEVPQRFVNQAAGLLARGEVETVLICGGETYYPRSADAVRGEQALTQGIPVDYGNDDAVGSNALEQRHGLILPIHGFPLFETALWARSGLSRAQWLARVGGMWARFSEVAARHPNAWTRSPLTAEEITTPSPANRPIGFPYTKRMVSLVMADIGAAVIMTTARRAAGTRNGAAQRVYFLGGGFAKDRQRFMAEKSDFTCSPALAQAAAKAQARAGMQVAEVECFDLYSCFPCAVSVARRELGLRDGDPRPLTLTGGLGFFGGPGSNYALHGIATMAETIASGRYHSGMTTALGWFMHKYAAGIYSATPNDVDLSACDREDEAHPEAGAAPVAIAERAAGRGRIETYTVIYDRDRTPARALVYGRTEDGLRFVANTAGDAATYAELTGENQVGRAVRLSTVDGLNRAEFAA
jgi:acetyl-CoA C-acetyltransferase